MIAESGKPGLEWLSIIYPLDIKQFISYTLKHRTI